MKIAIIGASGFIGSVVTRQLLDTTNNELVLFSHRASKLQFTRGEERRLKHIDGSVLSQQNITEALDGCNMAVYLVHLLGSGHDDQDEATAAHNFGKAALHQGMERVVYVGGMARAGDNFVGHLKSRHDTGKIIRGYVPQLIELHTPMVVGEGGAGFEVLKSMVRILPVFPVPKWARSITRPITVDDVGRYVIASLQLTGAKHTSVAIGGPERLSYIDLARRYAACINKRFIAVPLPFVSAAFASRILRLFKSNSHALTVADMIASAGFSTENDDEARCLFPEIKPQQIDSAL